MEGFKNSDGKVIVEYMIKAIQENAAYLSEVDGLIADGDHGINMNKGFTICAERISGQDIGFSKAMNTLGRVLLMEIGGSMGPLYGTFFRNMAKEISEKEEVSLTDFKNMLKVGLQAIQQIGKAKRGDKTLIDAIEPAIESLEASIDKGESFSEALSAMKNAAHEGLLATKDLVAKIGRAARLGERSRGVLDAGAASSSIILGSMSDAIRENLL